MQFVNPVSTQADLAINAVNLTGGGTAAGSTAIAGQFLVGNPATSHVIVGTDANGADGVRLYGADGITPLIDLNIASPFVAGSVVLGPVATATNATTATNLGGGGTAAGSTTITGAVIVGNPATSHVVVGSDALGADGVRLYASDGITPLIDLNITGTPTISGALIRTAAAGKRWEISTPTISDQIRAFTGSINENQPGVINVSGSNTVSSPFHVDVTSPTPNASPTGSARLSLGSATQDLSQRAAAALVTSTNLLQVQEPAGPVFLGQAIWDARQLYAISTATGAQIFNFSHSGGSATLSWDGGLLTVPGTSQWKDPNTGIVLMSVTSDGRIRFDNNLFFTTASSGANGPLPATVGGYLKFVVGTSTVRVPFYF